MNTSYDKNIQNQAALLTETRQSQTPQINDETKSKH